MCVCVRWVAANVCKGSFKRFQHLLQHWPNICWIKCWNRLNGRFNNVKTCWKLLKACWKNFEFEHCFNIPSTFSLFSRMLGLIGVVWTHWFNICWTYVCSCQIHSTSKIASHKCLHDVVWIVGAVWTASQNILKYFTQQMLDGCCSKCCSPLNGP